MIYLSMNDPPEEKMNIQEYIQSYRIVVYEKDLLQIGQTIEELVDNLKEASGLCGKPLGEAISTYDPNDMSWVIFIEKR